MEASQAQQFYSKETEDQRPRLELVTESVEYWPDNLIEQAQHIDKCELREPEIGYEEIGGVVIRASLNIPEEIDDETPLIVYPGYFGGLKDYESFSKSVASILRKPAICYDIPRIRDRSPFRNGTDIMNPKTLAGQAGWASFRHFKGMGDKLGINFDQVDGLGHSRGGQTLAFAAQRKPEIFRTVTFDSAAGLENHNLGTLAARLPEFFEKDLVPGIKEGTLGSIAGRKGVLKTIGYLAANPLLTASEAIDISKTNIQNHLEEISGEEIPIGMNLYVHDDLISGEKSKEASAHLADVLHIIDDSRLRHLAMQRYPDAMAVNYQELLASLHKS